MGHHLGSVEFEVDFRVDRATVERDRWFIFGAVALGFTRLPSIRRLLSAQDQLSYPRRRLLSRSHRTRSLHWNTREPALRESAYARCVRVGSGGLWRGAKFSCWACILA